MRLLSLAAVSACCVPWTAAPLQAQLTSPQVGWQAELSQVAHDVSGTVTVLDEDTIQVDDFTFDGGGISVYFYLGEEDTNASFVAGLEVGPELVGTSFDGSQGPLVYDLPQGQTLEGWHAVSVWCVAAGVSFGSGTYMAVTEPLAGDYDGNGHVEAADYTYWRDHLGSPYSSRDYDVWKMNYGVRSVAGRSSVDSYAVPEPRMLVLVTVAAISSLLQAKWRSHKCRGGPSDEGN